MLAPDICLVNGRVFTVDRDDRIAEAVAIYGGRVVAAGSTRDIRALAGSATNVVDLAGRAVIPGLTDPHVHLADMGTEELHKLDCRDLYTDCHSIPAVLERIRRHAAQAPRGRWIIAHGSPMQDFRMPEGRYPDRLELDSVAPDNPLVINFGGHISIVNSRGLIESGVDETSVAPGGGRIEIDEATGKLTGRLYERAQYLVRNPIGQYSSEEKKRGIVESAKQCLRRGVTTVHDIVIDAETIRAYHELAAEGALPIRVSLLVRVIESRIDRNSLLDLGLTTGFGNDWLRIGGVKMSIDGGATGHLSAFSEPYHDDPCNTGLIRIPTEELEETTANYHRAGHRLCIHAMGDVAMDMALTAIEKAVAAHPRADSRHRIEHMGNWMVTPERVERMRRLGVIPIPNLPFGYYLYDSLSAMLGAHRMKECFNLRTLLDAGLMATSGSDGPFYWPIDILRDIGAAVTRTTRRGVRFVPDEAVSVVQALRSATANAAFAGFEERVKGTIEPGRLADLVVLAEDPLFVAPERIKDIDVDLTIVGGRIAYARG